MRPAFPSSSWKIVVLLVAVLAACGRETEPASSSEAQTGAAEDTTASVGSGEEAASPAPGAKLNINTATEEELRTIPNVGDQMVHEFFEYRPYVSIRQFRQEIGKYVDEGQVAAYEQHIFVPVDPNDSDAETLQQIPGVDATVADALIGGRPYASRDAFLEALRTYLEEDELPVAETYVPVP